mmetsp:Transcript_19577/g.69303  ORF Transcript_19577/g.69303 Transcript_19577/m.69303 type:complete len:255 (-) Transcript_19577:1506-2270(-)
MFRAAALRHRSRRLPCVLNHVHLHRRQQPQRSHGAHSLLLAHNLVNYVALLHALYVADQHGKLDDERQHDADADGRHRNRHVGHCTPRSLGTRVLLEHHGSGGDVQRHGQQHCLNDVQQEVRSVVVEPEQILVAVGWSTHETLHASGASLPNCGLLERRARILLCLPESHAAERRGHITCFDGADVGRRDLVRPADRIDRHLAPALRLDEILGNVEVRRVEQLKPDPLQLSIDHNRDSQQQVARNHHLCPEDCE